MKIKKILAFFLLFLYLPLVYADVDTDNDGIIDTEDNCIDVYNPDQRDTNQDGYGNICDPDLDNDGDITGNDGDIIEAIFDLTPENSDWNPDADLNGDNEIEMSDVIIWMDMSGGRPGPSFGLSTDKDGWIDERDNCPDVANPDQIDTDGDGIGDACENTEETVTTVKNEVVTTNPVFVPTGSAGFSEFPEKVEVFTGDGITVNGKFVSSLNYNLYDLTFSLESEGLNPDWYTISPEMEFMVEEDEEVDVSVEFNIPEDAEIYTYSIMIEASAGSKTGMQMFSTTFNLLLKEKLKPLTTSSTSTTIPEEERVKSPLSGLYSFIQSCPTIVPVVIVIVLIIIAIFKIAGSKSKGEYVYGKGWVKCIKTFKSLSTSSIKDLLTKG